MDILRTEHKNGYNEMTDTTFSTSFIELATALKAKGEEYTDIYRENYKGQTITVIKFIRTPTLDKTVNLFQSRELSLNLSAFFSARKVLTQRVKMI